MEENSIKFERSDSSSIKVTVNNKGLYTHEIKIYFDNKTEDPSNIVKEVDKIEKELQEKFPIKH